MSNTLLIQQVTNALRAMYKKFGSIRSAYIYGSLLTDHFHKKSDIDVLFIVEDVTDRYEFLRRVKAVRTTIKGMKLDINVVFQSEFRHLWHIFLDHPRFLFG